MGVDLYASGYSEETYPAFSAAADGVKATCAGKDVNAGWWVDGGLYIAMLDISHSVTALRRACENVGLPLVVDWDQEISPEQMKEIASKARFREDEIPGAALSAKAFIDTCAELGIGAYFA